ncbi:hypothetical protein DRQ09_10165, partial [candidate division KSB1 bacterium]
NIFNDNKNLRKEIDFQIDSDRILYIIITDSELSSIFQKLANWKTRKGIKAKIFTTDWIGSNFDGTDLQEKVRNFIKFAYIELGTEWVLLGGDTNIIPDRKAYAMDCELGRPGDNDIPCDLYYADLDGNWDENNNKIYGEITDNIDLYPEVFIGRASVENPEEAENFIKKVLTYEISPPTDYQTKALFLAEILWRTPLTDGGIGKNLIENNFFPAIFLPVKKLYESLGNENTYSVLYEMNRGYHFINHDGHAWYSVISVGEGSLHRADFYTLRNAPKYSILYSIGCWPGAFDRNCMGEQFICAPSGGGVAFIGNSRYGWGSPGNPAFGYSNRFDQQFYRYLFKENIFHIGETLAAVKAHFADRSRTENVYRWHQFQLNLLGDPEMPVWTSNPGIMQVNFPPKIPTQKLTLPVYVLNHNGKDINDALVCIMKENEVYAKGLTDMNGEFNFKLSSLTPGYMYITVTAHNFLPFLDSILVFNEGAYISLENYDIKELKGNNDNIINPDEEIEIKFTLKNCSENTLHNIKAFLETKNPSVLLIDSTVDCGDLISGESLKIEKGLKFKTPAYKGNKKEPLSLFLRLESEGINLPEYPLSLYSLSPELSLVNIKIDDRLMKNSNNWIDPGDIGEVILTIKNTGLINAKNTLISLIPDEPDVLSSFPEPDIFIKNLPEDSTFTGSLLFYVNPECSAPYFTKATLKINIENEYSIKKEINISIGNTGFFDDMENGTENWIHKGIKDNWHITQKRKHSGKYSWYCGNESTMKYEKSSNSYLESTEIIVEPNSVLSFWHWYEVATYGVNGIYVEINDGNGWMVLDFIGSGGALNNLPIGNEWIEDNYDLSDFQPGKKIKIRFRFYSDNNPPAEGFYIDDVTVKSKNTLNFTDYKELKEIRIPENNIIFQNYPNPFN